MIKTIKRCTASLLMLCYVNLAFAQYAPDQMIVIFDIDMTEQEIIDLLYDEYNFEIIAGPTPVTRAYLTSPIDTVYPPWAYGNPGGPINGVIIDAKTLSNVNGAGLNYETFDALEYYDENFQQNGGPTCPENEQLSLSIHQLGANQTKTSVFDTGIAVDDYFSAYMNISNPSSFGTNFLNPEDAAIDDNNHGTSMPSIIVKHMPTTGNAQGGVGEVASSQIALKTSKTHNAEGVGYIFNKIEALDEGILTGVHIINMSFSYIESHEHRYDDQAPFNIALDHALTAGILCVTAAGNDQVDNYAIELDAYYPASFLQNNILSVAAIDCAGQMAPFSNYGNTSIDIAAPGINIPALDMNGNWLYSIGTSPATALTTSLATQLATHQTIFDYEAIKCAILNGNTSNAELYPSVLSGGYINATNAFDALLSGFPCDYSGGGPIQGLGLVTNPNHSNSLEAVSNQDGIQLQITAQELQSAQIYVFNVLGQLMVSKTIDLREAETRLHLNLPKQLHSGIYFISVDIAGSRETVKVFR